MTSTFQGAKPELGWRDGRGTAGNRALMEIFKRVRPWIEDELNIRTHRLHSYVQIGGVFLKDAAVLAGLKGSVFRVQGSFF